MHRCHLSIYDFSKRIGISKFGLTENIEKRIIIARGGISHVNTCIGGVGNGSNKIFSTNPTVKFGHMRHFSYLPDVAPIR